MHPHIMHRSFCHNRQGDEILDEASVNECFRILQRDLPSVVKLTIIIKIPLSTSTQINTDNTHNKAAVDATIAY